MSDIKIDNDWIPFTTKQASQLFSLCVLQKSRAHKISINLKKIKLKGIYEHFHIIFVIFTLARYRIFFSLWQNISLLSEQA